MVAVCRATVKVMPIFAPSDPFPQLTSQNKTCLAVRLANSHWHLKTELCSSIVIHPQSWNLYFALSFVDAGGKIIHPHDSDTCC